LIWPGSLTCGGQEAESRGCLCDKKIRDMTLDLREAGKVYM
jgi:hypothetical protein